MLKWTWAVVLLVSATARGQITVSDIAGRVGTPNEWFVTANVASTYQLESVTATIGSVSAPMTFSQGWEGRVDASALASGRYEVSVTARDVLGNTGSVVSPVDFQRPPELTLSAPGQSFVARPYLELRLRCVDETGRPCTRLVVGIEGYDKSPRNGQGTWVSLAEPPQEPPGSGLFVGRYDLAALQGQRGALTVVGTANEVESQRRLSIAIERSSQLVEAQRIEGFRILDSAPGRLLYADGSHAVVHPLDGGQAVRSPAVDTAPLTGSRLTGDGAVLVFQSPLPHELGARRTVLWDGGSGLEPIANNFAATLTQVAFETLDGEGVRVQSSSGARAMLPHRPVSLALGADDRLAYSFFQGLYLAPPEINGTPVEIGYAGQGPVRVLPEAVVACGPSGELQVHTDAGVRSHPGSCGSAAAHGAWLVVIRGDTGSTNEVWRLAPDGGEERVNVLSATHRDLHIGATGEVLYTVDGVRYLAVRGAPPLPLMSSLGEVRPLDDGGFEVLLENTIFSLQLSDAGPWLSSPDAGETTDEGADAPGGCGGCAGGPAAIFFFAFAAVGVLRPRRQSTSAQ